MKNNNNISIFTNKSFGRLRVLLYNGERYYNLDDIIKSLDLSNKTSVKSRIDPSGTIEMMVDGSKCDYISEPNLFDCIFQSRKAEALSFKKWITHEVIPSIARTGMYFTESALDKIMSDPNTMFNIVKSWKEDHEKRLIAESERDSLKLEVRKKDSKLEYYQWITKTEHLLMSTEMSKFLGTGPGIFNRILTKLKFQRKLRRHYELYQRFSDKNYGKVIEVPVLDDNGDPIVWNKQLNYTRDGKEYIIRWWKKLGLISEDSESKFSFNKDKAKEILGIKTDEELNSLEYEDEFI